MIDMYYFHHLEEFSMWVFTVDVEVIVVVVDAVVVVVVLVLLVLEGELVVA